MMESGEVKEADLVQSDEDTTVAGGCDTRDSRTAGPPAVTSATDCDTGLMEEAMAEQEKKSETSSSRSSEIVKIESPIPGPEESEATSADELDSYTATSSDIEVISSPSARGLPRTHQARRPESSGSEGSGKGHQRNVSDLSSGDFGCGSGARVLELETQLETKEGQLAELRRRVGQLEAVVTARENRLMAVSREIAQVQEESGQMSVRLEVALTEGRADEREAGGG